MLIDTHCHLSHGKFRDDREEVVERAQAGGVDKLLVPAENLTDAMRIGEIVKVREGVWGMAGYYPGNEGAVDVLRQFVENSREWVVAIGEIGLDIYWLKRQRGQEMKLFREQMELAREVGMPVVVHNRGAEEEIREVMDGIAMLPEGQFHCWSGSDEFLEYVLARGYYVGFCGNVTYPANESLRRQLRRLPKERLLLETDAPYLPPQGKRGERNEPVNVKITAEFVARELEMELSELARIVTHNAERLFGI